MNNRTFNPALQPPSNHLPVAYLPISTTLLRPAVSYYGPRFGILHPPTRLLTFGLRVQLEIYYFDGHGNIQDTIYTGVRGPIYAVESLSTNYIEFIIKNEEPTGHRYAYLLVPGARHGFVHMPLTFYIGWSQLHPFLSTTIWPGDAQAESALLSQVPVMAGTVAVGNTTSMHLSESQFNTDNNVVQPSHTGTGFPDSSSGGGIEIRTRTDSALSVSFGVDAGTGGPTGQEDAGVGLGEDVVRGEETVAIGQVISASE